MTGLPVFNDEAKDNLNDLLVSLSSRLSPDIYIHQSNIWHKANIKFYNLCRTTHKAWFGFMEFKSFAKQALNCYATPCYQDSQY